MSVPVNYEFEETDVLSYRAILSVPFSGKMMDLVFKKAVKKYEKKTGVVVTGDTDSVDKFEVPERYVKLLSNALNKNWRVMEAGLREDGVYIVSKYAKKAYYAQALFEGVKGWLLFVVYEGRFNRLEVQNG